MNQTPFKKLVNELWNVSRTALAGSEYPVTRYDRLQYIKKEIIKMNPKCIEGLSPKNLWLDISETIQS